MSATSSGGRPRQWLGFHPIYWFLWVLAAVWFAGFAVAFYWNPEDYALGFMLLPPTLLADSLAAVGLVVTFGRMSVRTRMRVPLIVLSVVAAWMVIGTVCYEAASLPESRPARLN